MSREENPDVRETIFVGVHELSYQLWPLHLHPREIPLADLNAIEAIRYRPIRDSGGWGIRLGRHGWYYTASGDRGVLIARDGERNIVIGSQSPEEFVEAIQRFRR